MKTIVFSPAAYNLAETTRTIEIAKRIQADYRVVFLSYGGDFEAEITKAGFELIVLEPRITPEKAEHIYQVDQGKKFAPMFSSDEIRAQVQAELAVFAEWQPAAVVTGFNFSLNISARSAGIPLIWLTHSTWMIDALYQAKLWTWPDMLDVAPVNWLPDRFLNWLSYKMTGLAKMTFKSYTVVSQEYDLPPLKKLDDIWLGDYNLLAEPQDFTGLSLPPTFHFISPLIARLDKPIPDEILALPRDLPVVYFAMGSSGQKKIIQEIVEGFKGQPFRVIAPVAKHLQGLQVAIPDNVLVTDWLPADKVNPMADISVIHGGIGTVMTACLAGKPVVGVSMMMEQEANIDALVRKGFAIRIRQKRFTPQKLNAAIISLLNDPKAQRRAREFQQITCQAIDDPSIERFFSTYFPN